MKLLETMSDFFTARVNGYDEHMLTNIQSNPRQCSVEFFLR